MCIYTRAVFECGHHVWGIRVQTCAVAESYSKGDIAHDCVLRVPHALKSVAMARECHKCCAIARRLITVKTKLEDCREAFRNKWPEYNKAKTKSSEEQSSEAKTESSEEQSSDSLDKLSYSTFVVSSGT